MDLQAALLGMLQHVRFEVGHDLGDSSSIFVLSVRLLACYSKTPKDVSGWPDGLQSFRACAAMAKLVLTCQVQLCKAELAAHHGELPPEVLCREDHMIALG